MTTPQDDLLDGELIASIADGTCVLFLGAGFTSAFSSVGGENVKTASELGESIVKSLIERLDGSSHVPARVIAVVQPGDGHGGGTAAVPAMVIHLHDELRLARRVHAGGDRRPVSGHEQAQRPS